MISIRAQSALPPENINFGFTDKVTLPFASIENYSHEWDRDTQNGVRVSKFSVLVMGKTCDQAEQTALALNNILDKNTTLTPQTMMCLQETWETGLTDPNNLYQTGVRLTFTLFEDPNK
ncbi:hypothetical protein [Fimbriiglobus ruber]|uniref:hypothetical protein n=1 Tax=Fimbriiglobus ruber TaxID=1908690 RepID=UPI001379D69B|nr:hypothetical protein [Fimbriiglobus ruber]